VAVTVRDSGPGIPAEEQPHVFERFRQAPGAEAGSGVGLAHGLPAASDE
jgi:signal transduction histidine kinase